MKTQLHVKMNEALYLRNPESTILGKNILKQSIILIHKSGFENFTFKKLAELIGTTEAGVYRYFENKHKLLVYLTAWYFAWIEFKIMFHTNNMSNPVFRLMRVISLLSETVGDDLQTEYIDESLLHQIIIAEGSKAYLTKQVGDDNKQQFFKPYKDLCAVISKLILDCNPAYKYPKSLASTLIEMAHFQKFFMNNLPSLTDFSATKNDSDIVAFLTDLVCRSLSIKNSEASF
ncbi:MAG: TetR/AcrR family transcriptional regulator [Alphaproteobacteria bacterium]|nr:TetR/AcrR family transcriptional regulator [Alphaproteobacteria bacterium]